jgi:ubiquinone/menaquinone biosynthesis C-methylase UbiE
LRLRAAFLLVCAALAGCQQNDDGADRLPTARAFPRAVRPVSKAISTQFSTEVERDQLGEAKAVMDLAAIGKGTTVADLGAGEGYYTIRLGQRVGSKGRVLAEDIDPGAIQRLGQRVLRERLDNVAIKTGTPDDPSLPANSFDRIFMVHMYHEVGEPYAFLWRLRPALKAGGQVIVVDLDRPTDSHGMPPALLFCEFAAVGFRLVQFVRKPALTGYYAQFEVAGDRPAPAAIKPCRLGANGAAVQH